jgi:hypothetical protein
MRSGPVPLALLGNACGDRRGAHNLRPLRCHLSDATGFACLRSACALRVSVECTRVGKTLAFLIPAVERVLQALNPPNKELPRTLALRRYWAQMLIGGTKIVDAGGW